MPYVLLNVRTKFIMELLERRFYDLVRILDSQVRVHNMLLLLTYQGDFTIENKQIDIWIFEYNSGSTTSDLSSVIKNKSTVCA